MRQKNLNSFGSNGNLSVLFLFELRTQVDWTLTGGKTNEKTYIYIQYSK